MGTGHHNGFSAPFSRIGYNSSGKFVHQIGTAHSKSGSAAFGLEGPIYGTHAQRFHDLVHRLGVFGTIKLQHVVRAYQQATVIAGCLGSKGFCDLFIQVWLDVGLYKLNHVDDPDTRIQGFFKEYF